MKRGSTGIRAIQIKVMKRLLPRRLPGTTGTEPGAGPFTHPRAVCPTLGVSGRHFGKMHPSPWPMVSLLGIHPEEILSRFQGHVINAVHHRTV